MKITWCCFTILSIVATSVRAADSPLTMQELEFFETKIRPVLVEKCESCHNSIDTAEAGFVLDHRSALRQGGQSGPPFDFKSPEKSLFIKVLRHEIDELKMPQGEDRLSEEVINDFLKWIKLGAPDPRQSAPAGAANMNVATWENTLKERKKWWSFQPITKPAVPRVQDESWSSHPIDKFIQRRLEEAGLELGTVADRRTLIRRLSFVLRGLPPTVEETEEFLKNSNPAAYEELVDQYLASPAFGEHWARHWMDLVRYAESHGSEGDPTIPNAWKYRDYLVRAFNADIPYDQLIREHIAGDLLPEPRVNSKLGLNESVIGPAHWRMCFHGFAPTDALDEKVRFTDDQINVFSKAFLGLTVSCARCHNHKFDPISQADYYAMFGVLGSTRPGILDASFTPQQHELQVQLKQIKRDVRTLVADNWLKSLDGFSKRVQQTALQKKAPQEVDLLSPFTALNQGAEEFGNLVRESQSRQELDLPPGSSAWDLTNQTDFEKWFAHGNGTANEPARAGDFALFADGERISPLLPAGVYSHLLSTKHRNIFSSPNFELYGEFELWVQVAGNGQSLLRYVVQNYPRRGNVYPFTTLNDGKWRWQKYDLTYWDGDSLHIEINTAPDTAVLVKDVDRSWFGIRNAVLAPKGTFQPPLEAAAYDAVFRDQGSVKITTAEELSDRYVIALRKAIHSWKADEASEAQVRLIEACRKLKLLNSLDDQDSELAALLRKYQQLEESIPLPNRVPGLLEADAADQALFILGNHHQPGAVVSRRFLEAIDPTPYETELSGRLQLAGDLVREDNPLTSRVAVNRLWHYLFGAGLVRTVDNFGQLGEKPSHPELLDELAVRFRNNGWSIKSLIREIVLTKTWQLKSLPTAKSRDIDPENRLLSHANIRRLEAEVLRDSLLSISGVLDKKMFGRPVGNATKIPRRSLYLSVRRNSLNPFLETFDFPVPFATKGRRDITNVPAQSLTLLNDPFVIAAAKQFAAQTLSKRDADRVNSDRMNIKRMTLAALGRPPSETELSSAENYLKRSRGLYQEALAQHQQIENEVKALSQEISSILTPTRQRLATAKQTGPQSEVPIGAPIAEWTFEKDFQDSIGNLHGKAKGGAKIEDGALILDGQSHVATTPIEVAIKAKTLEAVVQLTNLDQRGGGLVSIQDLSGTYFDAIVFGEQKAGHWLAGSNNFARTLPFAGTAETEAAERPVHIAITYAEDGTIQGFRNGKPYGKLYRKSEAYQFQAGKTQILFGLRHGNPSGNRLLSGKILEARLYDRALNPDEVQAIASGKAGYVSDREVLAALSSQQLGTVQNSQKQIEQLQAELAQLGKPPEPDQEWADFAHALFNLKEFLYIQ
ncbi:DUF1553 domain-containing protein [Thalassoglobus polymorphus]|uniref:Planctomycete cytochrome C n=1 Tax=Thalassoglobus polymorphus TaxID=2527994 RepID=A0A517QPX2_9PLAN|nr:DUF1553 domain-containing protein [Thalassoglobus polymorphus]QDT33689.1 Planctomycete cytochrome C [Thalassoglobus polymorphus]